MESFRHNDIGILRKHLHISGLSDETLSLVSGFADYLLTLSSQRQLRSVFLVASSLINIEGRTHDKSQITRHVCEWLHHSRNHEEDYRLDADRHIVNKINQIWSVLLALHIVIIPDSTADEYFGHMPRMLRDTDGPRALIAGLKAIGSLTDVFVDEKVGLVSQLRSENKGLKDKVLQLEEKINFLEQNLSQLHEQRQLDMKQQVVLDGLVSRVEQRLSEATSTAMAVTRRSHDVYPELFSNLRSAISEISETVDMRLRPVVVNDVHIREVLDRINKVVEDLKSSPTSNAHARSSIITDEETSLSWHLPVISNRYWNFVPSSSSEKIIPIIVDDWQAIVDTFRPPAWADLRQAIDQNIVGIAGDRKIPCFVYTITKTRNNSTTGQNARNVPDNLLQRMHRVVRGTPTAVYTHDDLSILALGPIPARECQAMFKLASTKFQVSLADVIDELEMTYKLHSPNVYRRIMNLVDAGVLDKTDDSDYIVQIPTNGYPIKRYEDAVILHQTQTERVLDISLTSADYEQPDWIAALIPRVLSIIYRTEFLDNDGNNVVVTERDRLTLALPSSGYSRSLSHLLKGLLFEHHRIDVMLSN